MKKLMLLFFVIGIGLNLFGQNKKNQEVDIISHQVKLGESIRLISKKYLVDPAEIYKLNKFAVEGISEGMVLRIPVPRKENVAIIEDKEDNTAIIEQPVQENIAAEKLPEKTTSADKKVSVIDRNSVVNHTVKSGETLYSIARKYNLSVDEIKLSNPQLNGALKSGQILKIPATRVLENNESSLGSDITPSVELKTSATNSGAFDTQHTVAPGETLYSLAKKYNVSVDDIKQLNAGKLQHGLQTGQVLIIRKSN